MGLYTSVFNRPPVDPNIYKKDCFATQAAHPPFRLIHLFGSSIAQFALVTIIRANISFYTRFRGLPSLFRGSFLIWPADRVLLAKEEAAEASQTC
jgi:hypothetical protein